MHAPVAAAASAARRKAHAADRRAEPRNVAAGQTIFKLLRCRQLRHSTAAHRRARAPARSPAPPLVSPPPASPAPRLSRRSFLAAAGVAGAGAASGLWLAREALVEVVHSAPPGAVGGGLRVALLTDLHAPRALVDVADLLGPLRAFDPHLVAIVGDSIDRRDATGEVRAFAAIAARYTTFATLGNHEYWSGCDLGRLRREYDRAGVRLLVNEALTMEVEGRPVRLVGLDDWRAGRPDYRLVADGVRPWRDAAQRVVLAHCPATFDDLRTATAQSFDTLAGHTHAGQIAPLGRPLFLPPGSGGYVKGWYAARGAAARRLYVSRGLGNSGVPIRVGAPPELALLRL